MTKETLMALKGATRMSTKNAVLASLIAAMLVIFTSVTQIQAVDAHQDPVEQQETQQTQGGLGRRGNAIVGTWLSQIPSGSKFIATFHQGGTVHITGQFDINATNNVVLSPRQGVWKHLGGRQFGITVLAVRYNPFATTTPPVAAGSLISYLKIQYLLTISEDGRELTGMNKGTTLDPSGNVVGNPTVNNNVPPYMRIEFEPFD